MRLGSYRNPDGIIASHSPCANGDTIAIRKDVDENSDGVSQAPHKSAGFQKLCDIQTALAQGLETARFPETAQERRKQEFEHAEPIVQSIPPGQDKPVDAQPAKEEGEEEGLGLVDLVVAARATLVVHPVLPTLAHW